MGEGRRRDLGRLKKLAVKVPMPRGLTAKNRRAVNQFDDPDVTARLHDLPSELWAEVKREQKPNFRTLAKAQAALAIALPTYIPLRPHNLHGLIFDEPVFLRDHSRATSSLEIPSDEVKNKETALAFDIPPQIAKMLIEYRDRIAPKVIGRRPERLVRECRWDTKEPGNGRLADQEHPAQTSWHRVNRPSVSPCECENHSRRPVW